MSDFVDNMMDSFSSAPPPSEQPTSGNSDDMPAPDASGASNSFSTNFNNVATGASDVLNAFANAFNAVSGKSDSMDNSMPAPSADIGGYGGSSMNVNKILIWAAVGIGAVVVAVVAFKLFNKKKKIAK